MIPLIFLVAALILALIAELEAEGRSILGWAVVGIAIYLLWGKL